MSGRGSSYRGKRLGEVAMRKLIVGHGKTTADTIKERLASGDYGKKTERSRPNWKQIMEETGFRQGYKAMPEDALYGEDYVADRTKKGRDAYMAYLDEKHGLVPGTTKTLDKFNNALVWGADQATKVAEKVGVPQEITQAYKDFAPPGSEYYRNIDTSEKFKPYADKAKAAASKAIMGGRGQARGAGVMYTTLDELLL